MSHQRKSLAHLADKFNVAPPPGYVPGRGRGISGFSKPPEEPPKRGSAAPSSSGAGPSGASSSKSKKEDSGLEGDSGDTRELDLSETQRFEEQEITMDAKEAGVQMEAFNMDAERQEGHFDDDFNYVWKAKGGEEDIKDAWLTETDAGDAESEEKVAKRRRLLKSQIEQLQADDVEVDTVALQRAAVALLEPRESVAAALRRFSVKPKTGQGKGGGRVGVGSSKEEREAAMAAMEGEKAAKKKLFNELTEAADALMRAGDLDIYSATKERLEEALAKAEEARAAAAAAEASAAAAAEATARGGVSAEVHEAAVAGGFEPHGGGLYFNATSCLFFDPNSSLYWQQGAGDEGPYYYFDSASQQFVDASQYAASGGETTGAGAGENGEPIAAAAAGGGAAEEEEEEEDIDGDEPPPAKAKAKTRDDDDSDEDIVVKF